MWPIPQEIVDLFTVTEEILNGKLHFLCSEYYFRKKILNVWKGSEHPSVFCKTTSDKMITKSNNTPSYCHNNQTNKILHILLSPGDLFTKKQCKNEALKNLRSFKCHD